MKHSKTLTSAASLASLFTAANNADAVINYFDSSYGFTIKSGNASESWDVDGDLLGEAELFGDRSVMTFLRERDDFRFVKEGTNLLALSSGFSLNSAAIFRTFAESVAYSLGPYQAVGFTDGVAGFMGFSFNPSGTTLYGWAEVTISSGGSFGEFEMLRWAYEDSGSAIQVGAIPEPKATGMGLGLLALGAVGLRRWRGGQSAA